MQQSSHAETFRKMLIVSALSNLLGVHVLRRMYAWHDDPMQRPISHVCMSCALGLLDAGWTQLKNNMLSLL